jgi:hypothetical protein
MNGPHRHHRLAALVVLGCATLAACGSTGQPTGTATGAAGTAFRSKTRDVAFSRCMRAHGVTNFPDPTSNGLQVPASVNPRSPAFRSAQNACRQYLPNGGEPPATNPADHGAALAFARCMRAHGLTDFPDPAMTPPTGSASVFDVHGMVFAFPTQIDPKSPAFRQAAHACGLSKA